MAANKYNSTFMGRFAFYLARRGSTPNCVDPLSQEFPDTSFNANDLNNAKMRWINKNGSDIFDDAQKSYDAEVSNANAELTFTNIKDGKKVIDESVTILINKLEQVNLKLSEYDPEEKLFLTYLRIQTNLMEQISKHSGLDDVAAVRRAKALALFKNGKGEDASAAIAGKTIEDKSFQPKFMDDVDDDEDDSLIDI